MSQLPSTSGSPTQFRRDVHDLLKLGIRDPAICHQIAAALERLPDEDLPVVDMHVPPHVGGDHSAPGTTFRVLIMRQLVEVGGDLQQWRVSGGGPAAAGQMEVITAQVKRIQTLCAIAFAEAGRAEEWTREALRSIAYGDLGVLERTSGHLVRLDNEQTTVGLVLQKDLRLLRKDLQRLRKREEEAGALRRIEELVSEVRDVMNQALTSEWRKYWNAAAEQNGLKQSERYVVQHESTQQSLSHLRYHPLNRRQFSRGL
ncbi:hypothetical protein JCM11641_006925 [Rhodosporidiobolus odoratus]